MNNLETKSVDFKVKGKNGLVNTYTIQRHKPEVPMCFIRTVTGHMLFCQENHPVWVQGIDNELNVVEAKEVVPFHHRIWVDNKYTAEDLNKSECISKEDYDDLMTNFLQITLGYKTDEILNDSKYFIGDSIDNYYINPNVLNNLNDIDLYLLLAQLRKATSIDENPLEMIRTYSFNLVSQVKQCADKLNLKCVFDIVLKPNEKPHWILSQLERSDDGLSIENYVDIEQVIYGVEGYDGYVYDLKTDSEEFMNNSVQTHNSFHCFHPESEVEIAGLSIDPEEFSMECLFDFANTLLNLPVKYDTLYTNGMTQDEIIIPDDVPMEVTTIINNEVVYTRVKKIIRHKQDPSTKMIKISYSTDKSDPNRGYYVISQDNHRHFKIENDTPVLVEAKDMKIDDIIWSYNRQHEIVKHTVYSIQYVENLEDDYVYDLTTESGTLFVNGILTHNTGGAAEFKKIDILKELKSGVSHEYESFIDRMFEQKENYLYSNADLLKIVVNKNLYQDEFKIKKEGDAYKLGLGYFKMYVGENEIRATIEMPVDLFITEDSSEDENEIVLLYGKGAKVFYIKFFKIAPEEVAQKIDKLVAGKSPWETPEDLLKKLHDNLSQFGPYDMTHIEVILSNILRNRTDPMMPARLKEPYDPVTYSIKTLPSVMSWSLGLAFENFSKSLSYGLISKDPGNLSQIEKVLYGEPLSDLSKKLLKERK